MDTQVIIVGGSYAGLSAALMLGRALKKVVIIDKGVRRNIQAHESHSYLTRDGENPNEIARIAREEVRKYKTVSFLDDLVTTVKQNENKTFSVLTEKNGTLTAYKVVLAYGVKDEMLPIPGYTDCWGNTVFTCPYCHAYEFAQKTIGVLLSGDMLLSMIKLILQWSTSLVVFLNGGTINQEHENIISKLKIPIVRESVKEIAHQNGKVKHVVIGNGKTHDVDAILAVAPFHLNNSQIVTDLGLALSEPFKLINVDAFGKTNIKGVFAAGDCATFVAQMSVASALGATVGVIAHKELVEEEFAELIQNV